ncbi:MAG: NUDIX hydrolase [Alphaproteobacteria bacterium]
MNDATERGGTAVGGPCVRMIPEGDERSRLVCRECGFIFYENPKMIVGAVVTWEDRYLLCRRAIDPRRGFWTMPAGFMELTETAECGARREVLEEAGATVEVGALLAIYSLPQISQVHLIYRASMITPDFAPGTESLEVRLFTWEEIPWVDLAYPNVGWSLHHHRDLRDSHDFAPRGVPPGALSGCIISDR